MVHQNFEIYCISDVFCRANSFNFVLNLVPVSRSDSGVSIAEMLRVITSTGYGILGAPAHVWQGENLFEEIQSLDKQGKLTFLSLQSIKCPVENDPNNLIEYSLTVFRKGDQVRIKYT